MRACPRTGLTSVALVTGVFATDHGPSSAGPSAFGTRVRLFAPAYGSTSAGRRFGRPLDRSIRRPIDRALATSPWPRRLPRLPSPWPRVAVGGRRRRARARPSVEAGTSEGKHVDRRHPPTHRPVTDPARYRQRLGSPRGRSATPDGRRFATCRRQARTLRVDSSSSSSSSRGPARATVKDRRFRTALSGAPKATSTSRRRLAVVDSLRPTPLLPRARLPRPPVDRQHRGASRLRRTHPASRRPPGDKRHRRLTQQTNQQKPPRTRPTLFAADGRDTSGREDAKHGRSPPRGLAIEMAVYHDRRGSVRLRQIDLRRRRSAGRRKRRSQNAGEKTRPRKTRGRDKSWLT